MSLYLSEGCVKDHIRWMKQIRDSDDYDRCEWMNVSSGIGHPRCPRQNPQSCKTVVCVLVPNGLFKLALPMLAQPTAW